MASQPLSAVLANFGLVVGNGAEIDLLVLLGFGEYAGTGEGGPILVSPAGATSSLQLEVGVRAIALSLPLAISQATSIR